MNCNTHTSHLLHFPTGARRKTRTSSYETLVGFATREGLFGATTYSFSLSVIVHSFTSSPSAPDPSMGPLDLLAASLTTPSLA